MDTRPKVISTVSAGVTVLMEGRARRVKKVYMINKYEHLRIRGRKSIEGDTNA